MARTLPDLPTLTVLADPSEPITCPAQALKRLYQIEKTDPQKCAGLLSGDLVLMDNPLKLTNDLQAINEFLTAKKGNTNTLRRYKLDLERALLWMLCERQKPLSSARRNDFDAYAEFLVTGSVPQHNFWRGPRCDRYTDKNHTRINKQWRPFMDKMSAASRDHVMTVVGGALNWMNEQGYLKINVLFEYNKKEQDPSKLNQKNADQAIGFLDAPPLQSATNPMNNVSFIDALEEETEEVTFEAPGIQRYIPLHVWNEVVHYIDNLPKETVSQARGYHQLRWLIRGMYCTGARVHEFASHPMRSFVQNKQGLWYWVVIGKGGKRASVPVLDPLPEILTDYRQFLCKPEKITQSESTMITLNRTGNDDIKKRQVFALVKNLFNEVAETLDDEDDCNLLRGASPHWIRHSVITHLLDEGKSLEYVSRFARHSSIEMTRKYYHIDLTKIHDALNSSS